MSRKIAQPAKQPTPIQKRKAIRTVLRSGTVPSWAQPSIRAAYRRALALSARPP